VLFDVSFALVVLVCAETDGVSRRRKISTAGSAKTPRIINLLSVCTKLRFCGRLLAKFAVRMGMHNIGISFLGFTAKGENFR